MESNPGLPSGWRKMSSQANSIMPLSECQAGIWFAQHMDRSRPVYNIAQYVEIHGPIDPGVFERALRQTAMETESLRARFIKKSDGPWLLLGPLPDWSLAVLDVSAEPDPLGAAEAWMRADLDQLADPTKDQLYAYALFKAASDRFLWYQRYNHLVMDGFGCMLMARRVAGLYTSF